MRAESKVDASRFRRLNLTGLTEREKEKQKMFMTYDVERKERELKESLGSVGKYISRPIMRLGVSRYQIDEFKEEAYKRIE